MFKATRKRLMILSGYRILSAEVQLERLELIATIVSDQDGPALRKLTGISGIQCKELFDYYLLTDCGEEGVPAGGVGLESWTYSISVQCTQKTVSHNWETPEKSVILLTTSNQRKLQKEFAAEESGKGIIF